MNQELTYGGKVFFIDRDNVNTDEIIPAKYLTYIEKAPLKPHLLEDLKVEGLDPSKIPWDEYGVIVSRSNFGSGSSREMAVWAFEVNGIRTLVAVNFARIFRENCFNNGVLAIELPRDVIDELFSLYKDSTSVSLDVDLDTMTLKFSDGKNEKTLSFELDDFQKDLIRAGGWVALAQQKY